MKLLAKFLVKSLVKALPGLVASVVALSWGDARPVRSQPALDFAPPPTVNAGGVNQLETRVAEVNFAPPSRPPVPSAPSRPVRAWTPLSARSSTPNNPSTRQIALFAGGADSLVSRTVGHAEGTRAVDGSKTNAYNGHVDPGNGVWNLGSFSFQHCKETVYQCSTPEEADVYQLRRLQVQSRLLLSQAEQLGLRLTLAEHLNGIDLANQAPLAALGTPGYVALLRMAQSQGLPSSEAVLWARTHAYWNAQTQRWDAPGLGNTEGDIRYDQNRRMVAIAAALDLYDQSDSSLGQIAMTDAGKP